MERKRGFEVISAYEGKGINVPKRSTKHSAGYDFEAAEDIVLPSIWKMIFKFAATQLKQWIYTTDKEIKKGDRIGQGIFLPFLKADTDEENDMNERTGGFGSSGVR